MKTYILMQMPCDFDRLGKCKKTNQIIIIDTSTITGKNQIKGLKSLGAVCIGFIKSKQSAHMLAAGFKALAEQRLSEAAAKMQVISQLST